MAAATALLWRYTASARETCSALLAGPSATVASAPRSDTSEAWSEASSDRRVHPPAPHPIVRGAQRDATAHRRCRRLLRQSLRVPRPSSSALTLCTIFISLAPDTTRLVRQCRKSSGASASWGTVGAIATAGEGGVEHGCVPTVAFVIHAQVDEFVDAAGAYLPGPGTSVWTGLSDNTTSSSSAEFTVRRWWNPQRVDLQRRGRGCV